MDAAMRMATGRLRFLNTLAAATAVTVSLAACGVSSPTGTAGPGSSSSGGTLNIGVLAPYTGDNAIQGAISSAGCVAGIAPVNAAGGVLGASLACKASRSW
jgi:ABC-type branched-subunit amino acid transport system substrate-binding protein